MNICCCWCQLSKLRSWSWSISLGHLLLTSVHTGIWKKIVWKCHLKNWAMTVSEWHLNWTAALSDSWLNWVTPDLMSISNGKFQGVTRYYELNEKMMSAHQRVVAGMGAQVFQEMVLDKFGLVLDDESVTSVATPLGWSIAGRDPVPDLCLNYWKVRWLFF